MGFDRDDETPANASPKAPFATMLERRLTRRRLLSGGLVAAGAALLGPTGPGAVRPAAAQASRLGFTGVPIATTDAVTVPPGYTAEVLYAWGDPISAGPAFKPDASNCAEEQPAQAGMHHDGMHFFPLPAGGSDSPPRASRRQPRVHRRRAPASGGHGAVDGGEGRGRARPPTGCRWSRCAATGGKWSVVRPSRTRVRVTARDAHPRWAGPRPDTRGSRPAADPTGQAALGTLNNCASGPTPVGDVSHMRGELQRLLRQSLRRGAAAAEALRHQRAAASAIAGTSTTLASTQPPTRTSRTASAGSWRWIPTIPARAGEAHRAGPLQARGRHGAVAADRRVVVYMGDDERFEYIYKFVSRRPLGSRDGPRGGRAAAGRGDAVGRAFPSRRQRASGASSRTAGTVSMPAPASPHRRRY